MSLQFTLSLELCRGRITTLADYESKGLVDRDCSADMQKYLFAYCLWLNSVYTVGVSVQGFSNLAASVKQIPGLDKQAATMMDDTISFNQNGMNEWLSLWSIHIFQYMNPPFWKEYLRLSDMWYEEVNTPKD